MSITARNFVVLVLFSFVLALFTPGPVAAQTSNGTLVGAVTDQTGAVIPGVDVKVVSPQYGEVHEATTDSVGTYRIESLQPGTYSVTFTATGLAAMRVGSVIISGSVTTTVNGQLQLSSVESTITVEAGAAQVIDTQSGQLGESLSTRDIESLPYGSFNAAELAMTLPGVQDIPAGQGAVNAAQYYEGESYSVNGTRPRGNSFLIDGQDDNDYGITGQAYQPTNLGLIQEFTILTNSYSAQFGRGGGSVGNYITKSGSNTLHGEAWEVNDDSYFAADDAANKLIGVTRPLYIENTFGFDVGGPVIKDKLFFFGTAQWDRTRQRGDGSTFLLPDAAGIATLQALPNPNAQLFLASLGGLVAPSPTLTNPAVPMPLGNDAKGNPRPDVEMTLFARNGVPVAGNDRDWDARLDWHMGPNDTLTGSYLRDDSATSPDFFANPGALPPFDTNQGGASQIFKGQWTHIASTKLVNELRFSYTNIGFLFNILPSTLAGPLANVPDISFEGTELPSLGVSTNFPQGRSHKTTQAQEALTYSLGRHTITGGADITFINVRDTLALDTRGSITYEPGGGYSGFANFIDDYTGASGSIDRTFGNPIVLPNVIMYAPYVQDSWRVKENFTLSLGLRYEYWGTPANVLQYPAINYSIGFGLPGATFPSAFSFPERPDRNNFAPRLGIAYTPHWGRRLFGHEATVLRAGYGVFYDGLFTNIIDNEAEGAPNTTGGTVTGGAGRGQANSLATLAAITPVADSTATEDTIANNLVNPVTQQWNLDIQRELPGKMVLTVAYVGTRGTHLFANQDFNPTVNYGPRINPIFGEVVVRGNAGQSWFNSGQVELERSLGTGLTFRAAYTYAKYSDDASEIFTTTGLTSYAQILTCQKCDWGPSTFDRRHRFVGSYVWSMPYAKENRLLRALTDQWQWSGIATFETGTPNNVLDGFDNIGNGHPGSRPNLGNKSVSINNNGIDGEDLFDPVTGNTLTTTPGTYFALTQTCINSSTPETDCIEGPASSFHFLIPSGGPGNVHRNSLFGPGQIYFDTSIQRRFAIPIGKLEHQRIIFRTEFFNAFNHPNLFTPTYVLIDPEYNNAASTIAGGRVIKFWLKYEF
ncbi:MAG: carboxypeptidase regulatory-like domain-containing protein [Candidatus Acidiferrales bacterium]